jgi:tetratricopeptide (TPR) repeat protein
VTATANSKVQAQGRVRGFLRTACAAFALFLPGSPLLAADTNTAPRLQLLAQAQEVYLGAQRLFEAEPTNNLVAWQFARAAFSRGEFATNDTERAALAVQGIAACRKTLQRDPKCAPAHYYLGLNLGQLARTKLLGALPLVSEMEGGFKTARQLDELFDHAGPDRFLGQLYFQAPGWPASVGSQSKARKHLTRAVELAPDYPENRLNLAEASLKWRDKKLVQRELEALENLWPAAKTNFAGADWAAFWADWQPRYDKLRENPRR